MMNDNVLKIVLYIMELHSAKNERETVFLYEMLGTAGLLYAMNLVYGFGFGVLAFTFTIFIYFLI